VGSEMCIRDSFNTRKDAEDFYELNREETYYVPGTDNPDSEVH